MRSIKYDMTGFCGDFLKNVVFSHLSRCLSILLLADGLVKKLEELEKTAGMYRGLMDHTKRLVKAFFDLSQSHKGTLAVQMLQ